MRGACVLNSVTSTTAIASNHLHFHMQTTIDHLNVNANDKINGKRMSYSEINSAGIEVGGKGIDKRC